MLATRDTELMHSRISEITTRRKWTTGKAIKDVERKVLMEVEDIKNRWFKYVGKQFRKERDEMRPVMKIEAGSPILTEEIE